MLRIGIIIGAAIGLTVGGFLTWKKVKKDREEKPEQLEGIPTTAAQVVEVETLHYAKP